MRLRIAGLLAIVAALVQTASADRPHNIFDDDWTPPKVAQPRPAPVVKPTPTPADGPAKVLPSDVTPKETTPVVPPVTPAARLAVPAGAAQAAVRKVMKEVFADQLADRSIAARRKLTATLLAQVDKSTGAPVEQFVLLAAAIDSAIDAVNLPAAIRAANRMAETFEVDGLGIKADAALRLGPKSGVADSAAENVGAVIDLSSELARADDYATAVRVCTALMPAAASNPALRGQLQQRQHELAAARDASEHYARDLAKLNESPNDPAANLAVGRYLCFLKGEWESGLANLAKGSDAALKSAAALELGNPSAAGEIANVGDAWWEAASKQGDLAQRSSITAHAVALYMRAGDQIMGLRKVQIEKRIAEAAKNSALLVKTASAGSSGVVNLLKLIDIKRDAVEGAWKYADAAGGPVESPPRGNTRLAIRYQPPEEYDFHVEFTRLSGDASTVQIFTHGNHRCAWLVGWGDNLRGFETISGGDASHNVTCIRGPSISTIGRRYSSIVQVRKGSIAAYLDGKLVVEFKTDGSDLNVKGRWNIGEVPLGLGGTSNDTIFHVVEIREVTGHGKAIP